ncbi:MAG TPA: SIR2 family protein [Candidatus Baltobacteraceae bacterium]|jgi:hypothetical protein
MIVFIVLVRSAGQETELLTTLRAKDPDVVTRLAQRIVDGSFVPFIGAGCSRELLAGNDWAGITEHTRAALGSSTSTSYTAIAQEYEERFGRAQLVDFLRCHLTILKWDDKAGYAQLAMMELRFPSYYTTNVDDATEACYRTYNKRLHVVVVQEDLKARQSGAPTLYKFHGDLRHPDLLVWTSNDYKRRLASDGDSFMHVLLRADVLAKSLLFIGYSLQDPHILDLLDDMRTRYPDAMKESVIVEFGISPPLREKASELEITVVHTSELYDVTSPAEAFDLFLADLGIAVKAHDTKLEMETLFSHDGPGLPVLSDYDLRSLEDALPNIPPNEQIKGFRATCCWKSIPIGFESRILDLYQRLCLEASARDVPDLTSALFLMEGRLSTDFLFGMYSAAFTLYRHPAPNAFGHHIVLKHLQDLPMTKVLLISLAAALLKEHNLPRNQSFADSVAMVPGYGKETLDEFQEPARSQVAAVYADIFHGSARENPLEQPNRPLNFGVNTFQQLRNDLIRHMPPRPQQHGKA